MSSKARRPHGLILQAHVQQNLQGTLALHRQHLQQASQTGAASSCPRPPQLPGVGLPSLSSTGYPPPSPEAAGSPSCVRVPQRRASSSSSSRAALGATGGSIASSSPSHSRSRRHARAESLEAKSGSSARRSPSSASAAEGAAEGERLSPRTLLAFNRTDCEDDEDDDELFQQLEELQELSSRLGLTTEEGGSSGSGALEPRPTTGGTSTSVSTTARGGSSSAGCTASEDDPGGEAWGEGGFSFYEEGEIGLTDWRGAVCASWELQSLRLPHGCRVEKSPGSSGQFFFTVDVGEGPFTPATLTFWVKVFDDFPGRGSCSVRCTQRIFHPCVDPTTGRIAIPDEVYEASDKALSALLTFVRQLILTPRDSPAANADAALLLQTDPEEFRRMVRFTLNGGQHGGQSYDKVLQTGKPAAKAAAAEPHQASMADDVRLKVMRIEVMKDQFKRETSEMQRRNSLQISSLEE